MDFFLTMGDCYVSLVVAYFRTFQSIKAPHQLRHYTPNLLALRNVANQTYVGGFAITMIRKNKLAWPKLLLQVGEYKVENVKQAVVEVKVISIYYFGELPYY